MAQIKQPTPTLLVGLGGTGEWTALHVKRQLFDAYDNRMPPNVAIAVMDTDKNQRNAVGVGTFNRAEGMGIGRTVLDTNEYIHIGGDAWQIVNDTANTDRYPHLKSWLLAERLLTELDRPSFQLEQGAGQFRQLGRLAVFRDVATPSISGIASIVETKLINLQQKKSPDAPPISVAITGSLAGGTGAGTFIDIAHLVTRVAEVNNIDITLRAFLYLPQAFKSTLTANEIDASKGRAFAALRELRRFLLNEDYKYGYPMYYHSQRAGVNPAIWRAESTGKLFDFVYLIDGEGESRMNTARVKDGAAAVVADAIMAFIDENYGPDKRGQDANVRKNVLEARGEFGHGAFVSAVGAYSIILPMQQILEGWAYQFSREMLDLIIPAERTDNSQHMIEMSRTGSPEKASTLPEDEARRLLTSMTPVFDPTDADQKREIRPTMFWVRTEDMFQRARQNEQQMIRTLDTADLPIWLEMLLPTSQDQSPEARALFGAIGRTINDKVQNYAPPSNERQPKGDPRTDHADIKQKSEAFITKQLGMSDQGGGRKGGEYGAALEQALTLQMNRLRQYMTAYITAELNGDSHRDPIVGKTGKLGWMIGAMEELRNIFAANVELMETVRASRGGVQQGRRTTVERTLPEALKAMTEARDKTRATFGDSEAIKTQKTYLQAVEEYVAFYRTDFARTAVLRLTARARDFIQEIIDELKRWGSVLGLDPASLYNRLSDGMGAVATDRKAANDVKNHRVISENTSPGYNKWEADRYQRYTGGDTQENIFRVWNWSAALQGENGGGHFSLEASLDGQPLRKDIGTGRWSENNLALILEYCRQLFRRQIFPEGQTPTETVLAYLMEREYPDAPKALAGELKKNGGYTLSFESHGRLLPSNIVLALNNINNYGQNDYLKDVITQLIALANLGGDKDQANPSFQHYACADPFRLTYLNTANLIMLEQDVNAYRDCETRYLSTPWTTRQRDHIFGAEVRAITYEKEIGTGSGKDFEPGAQEPRTLTDRVCLLLENEDRFTEFLMLYSYNVAAITDTAATQNRISKYFRIYAPTTDTSKKGKMEEWRLTKEEQNPSLLDATARYVLVGSDITNEQRKFPYPDLKRYLNVQIEKDTTARIERDDLALNDDQEMRAWLEAFMPPLDANGQPDLTNWTKDNDNAFLEVAKLVAVHDRFQLVVNYLKQQLPGLQAKKDESMSHDDRSGDAHNQALRSQEEFDLYTAAVIALENQIFQYRDAVEGRYIDLTGAGGGLR